MLKWENLKHISNKTDNVGAFKRIKNRFKTAVEDAGIQLREARVTDRQTEMETKKCSGFQEVISHFTEWHFRNGGWGGFSQN